MLKGEFSIIAVGLLTFLLLFMKLTMQQETTLSYQTTKTMHPTKANPCHTSLCATILGNLRIGDNFIELGERKLRQRDRQRFFSGLDGILKPAALTIANLETPLIERPPKEKRATNHLFWAEGRKLVNAMGASNITAVSLANRHILDFGEEGVIQTIGALRNAGIDVFGIAPSMDTATGAGRSAETDTAHSSSAPVNETSITAVESPIPGALHKTLSAHDKSIEMIAIGAAEMSAVESSHAPRPIRLELEKMADQIRELRARNENHFIMIHLKNAAVRGTALKMQQSTARTLIDAGADLIVGCGSRFIQVPELYKNKWIIYSLGEAAATTNSPIAHMHKNWPFSGALQIIWERAADTRRPAYRLYPMLNHVQKTDYTPRLLDRREFGSFFWYLLRKGTIEYDRHLKKKMFPGEDTIGHFIELGGHQ